MARKIVKAKVHVRKGKFKLVMPDILESPRRVDMAIVDQFSDNEMILLNSAILSLTWGYESDDKLSAHQQVIEKLARIVESQEAESGN